MLPKDKEERKRIQLYTGLFKYFPDALCEVARCSVIGGEQHHPGQPVHWERGKSSDQEDCLLRHLMEKGIIDDDGISHTTKVAWRALAMLQTELEENNRMEAHEPSRCAFGEPEATGLKIPPKVAKFLNDNEALQKYIDNLNRENVDVEDFNDSMNRRPSSAIIGFFDWDKSPEGRDFWRGLHDKLYTDLQEIEYTNT